MFKPEGHFGCCCLLLPRHEAHNEDEANAHKPSISKADITKKVFFFSR